MTDNVQSLHGDPVIQRKADPDVVKLLKGMLEEAQSGEIIGFVGAILHCNDLSSICRAGIATRVLLGSLTMTQHCLIRDFEAEE